MPLRVPSCAAEMCTRIRFLGWAPGSRVPPQSPTIGGASTATARAGRILNPSISVNPKQSPNDDARCFFMVDLPFWRDIYSLKLCFLSEQLSFIKTSYTHNINDLAPSSIGNVPVRFLAGAEV